jgi:hypothetical protein
VPLKVYTKTFGAPPSFHCSKNYNLNLSAKHRDAPKKTTAKVAAVVMKICLSIEGLFLFFWFYASYVFVDEGVDVIFDDIRPIKLGSVYF